MVYSSLILLFELWLVHAAISRMRNNEAYRFVLYRMRQSRYQKIYTTMNTMVQMQGPTKYCFCGKFRMKFQYFPYWNEM
ncbi:hypothetical protein T03_10404 [Trichinella britovi]|uniref:Secreted protein n=1 Tax=Trichinella britovi TaxID=45882 RepID=A0A0V1CU70_TRIBR|nr:hypothetical protein T03_10404 [Trichinella britovi]